MENFFSKVSEILEVDKVELSQELTSFECWDSLTILSIIALASDSYDVTLTAEEVKNSSTIGGLLELIRSRFNG